MSAIISAQFIKDAKTVALADSAAIHLTMGTGTDSGYGGVVTIHLRNVEEATMLLNAASQAHGILTRKDETP